MLRNEVDAWSAYRRELEASGTPLRMFLRMGAEAQEWALDAAREAGS